MPDAAIPIFQTINQQGEATLEVEAVIKALGLKLVEATSFAAAEKNSVEWLKAGEVKERIFGIESFPGSGIHELVLEPEPNTGLGLFIKSNGTLEYLNKVILNSSGQSNFLQLPPGLQKRTCNFGLASNVVGWGGGQNSNVNATVSHGLAVNPAMILCNVNGATEFGLNLEVQSANAVNFEVRGWATRGPLIGSTGLWWIAIG